MKTKICIKCGKERLLKFFYFRKDQNKYRNECIFCMGKGLRKSIFIDFIKKLKQCTKCRKIKSFTQFYLNKNSKNKLTCECKQCRNKVIKKHRNQNKKYYQNYRKSYEKQVRKIIPWKLYYKSAKGRCENINTKGYKNYGGRGIKFLLTLEEVKKLWFEYCAWRLIKPSLDRIDNDGNYTYDNCQFIEMKRNAKFTRKTLQVKQYDLNGKLIQTWESYKDLLKDFHTKVRNSKIFLNYKWEINHYGRKSKNICR